LEELPDDVVVRVVVDGIRSYRPVGDDRRRARAWGHDPREGDGRPGLGSKNRGVAEVGALDDDIDLGLTFQVGVGRADDSAGDRVALLNVPM
jgi:hypothetical protein